MNAKRRKESQVPPAKAADLRGLVDYSPDAVISRTLLKNAAGNITLFSFDKGQGLSEHTAPFDAFVQIVEGTGDFRIGGKKVIAKRGEILVMPAGVPHSLHARVRFKMLLTMLRPEATQKERETANKSRNR